MSTVQIERALEALIIALIVIVFILPFYLLLKLVEWAKD